MSVTLNPVSPSENTTSIHSINLNLEEKNHNNTNVEKLACELKEKTNVINSNSIEQLDKKPGDQEDKDETHEAKENDSNPHDNNKVDEDLSKCEQQIVGNMIGTSAVGENKGPKVEILNLSVLSPGRKDRVIEVPFPSTTSKATLFTLKEGSKYQFQYHFKVSKDVVTGLTYTYMVWKAGIKVNQTKKMMGTFSPREEPYIFESSEGTTPSGFFARGPFLVRSKFVDDEGNCYMDTTYYFDIRKDWGANDKC